MLRELFIGSAALAAALAACFPNAVLVLPGGGGSDAPGGSGGAPTPSSASGGDANSGGAPPCDDPSDCRDDDTDCEQPTCVAGRCDVEPAPSGTACSLPGGKVCDGEGQCLDCLTSDDCDNEQCIDDVCGGPKALGEPCPAAYHCASGFCVDGVCCESACDGECVSCLGTDTCDTDGTCEAVVPGTDPGDDCPANNACYRAFGCQPVSKLAFATSSVHTGNLAGLAGADSICQQRATEACLGGSYLAWLSSASESPSSRFTQATAAYRLVTGTTIATNWIDLVDGALGAPIDRDEKGNAPPASSASCAGNPNVYVHTGTTTAGEANTTTDRCGDFTNTTGSTTFGRTDQSGGAWTFGCTGSANTCAFTMPIYCFQQ